MISKRVIFGSIAFSLCISIVGIITQNPKEFENSLKIDYKLMFEKNVLPVISRIFYIIGWPLPAIGCEQVTDIISLFSGDKNNL